MNDQELNFIKRLKNALSFDVQQIYDNMMEKYQLSYAEYVFKDVYKDITILKRRKNIEKYFRKMMIENHYSISPMGNDTAAEIANCWHYPSPYEQYDISANQERYENIYSLSKRYNSYFQIIRNGELFGYVIYTVSDKRCHLEFGMKPNYIGNGFGKDFLNVIEEFAQSHFKAISFEVVVSKDNERLLRLLNSMDYDFAVSDESTMTYKKEVK